ncbi:quinon protein alcohol dehydrogenase-like superfamily [Exophiala viscosa]|uniref:quinon protein alcohol dehydrogenase-like superfamily n=1 Tax=Exophiala viscosa TaxID=2486360 RepID=UPI00219FAA8F|nr:quinon protein alcohol dehydrogenase-like superfamily [Exophiala viscosa]
MDIHRCRFVQYPAQSINALAFSHTSRPKEKTPSDVRLAVGRQNGDVEVWNPAKGLWVQETILKGRADSTIEHLEWTRDLIVEENADGPEISHGPLRLLSSSGSKQLLEWDISSGSLKRQVEGNSGDIWCFAAQPQLENPKDIKALESGIYSPLVAAGCANGTVVLFSTEDGDLRYLRPLLAPPAKKPKVLSIAWRDRNTIIAGYEDSTIRVIELSTRKILRSMSLGKGPDGNDPVVWAVKYLPDGTIISGDSSGQLKIWNAKNFTLLQTLKSHAADILDIVVNANGDKFFSLGADRRTFSYQHSGSKNLGWVEISHRRYHRHDVKCGAAFESKDLSVLVSGGLDCKPIVVPIRKAQGELHRALSHLPQQPLISASPSSRLFMSWWGNQIVIYQVRKPRNPEEQNFDFDGPTPSSYETLAQLVVQGDEHIQNAQLSADGQFIVAATINGVKLFQLRKTQAAGRPCLRTRQVELPPAIVRLGARQAGFSPDGKWLYTIRKDNTIALNKLVLGSDPKDEPAIHEKTVKLYRVSRKQPKSSLGTYPQTITHVAFSSDSRVLAVGDVSGAIDTWVLEGHEDVDYVEAASDNSDNSSDSSSEDDDEEEDESPVIHAQKWIRNPSGSQLPQLDSSILALTFRPSDHPSISNPVDGNRGLHATRHTAHPVAHELPSSNIRLIAVTATHQVVEFDVLSCRLSEWSRRNPSKYLPHAFTRLKDRVVGCFWDCTDPETHGERLWLYGSNWLFMLDVSQDLQEQNATPVFTTATSAKAKVASLGGYDVVDPVESNPPAATNGHAYKKRKRNTGAGDAIPEHQRPSGVGSTIRKFKNDRADVDMVDMDGDEDVEDQDTDMVGDENGDDSLALMRRRDDQMQQSTKPSDANGDGQPAMPRPTHWCTFEYRSILGVGVIGPSPPESSDLEGKKRGPLEVVIVERDVYDVPKGPRLDVGQEWDT